MSFIDQYELTVLRRKNKELKDRIQELEDDNARYMLGKGESKLENPRFKVTNCPFEIIDTSNNHIYWLENEYHVKAIVDLLNGLNDVDNNMVFDKTEREKLMKKLREMKKESKYHFKGGE